MPRRLLRQSRQDAGMSQQKLAAKLKKPQSYVHKCEVAERRIDPPEFIDWCLACGIDPSATTAGVVKTYRKR